MIRCEDVIRQVDSMLSSFVGSIATSFHTHVLREEVLFVLLSRFPFLLFVHGTLTDDWEKAWFVSRVLPLFVYSYTFYRRVFQLNEDVGFNQGSL